MVMQRPNVGMGMGGSMPETSPYHTFDKQQAMVAGGHTKRQLTPKMGRQLAMVAGVGFEPTTFRL